jgi:2'-5' RNA ligase
MRTFIAIELPHPVQKQINQLQMQLQTRLRDRQSAQSITWTFVTKIHLTLRFLGETNQAQHEIISHRLTQVTMNQPAFQLSLGALGCFPNFREPNVVWLGLQGELAKLEHLQKQIEQFAREADFVPENRPFAPHITIGRARRHSNRPELRRAGAALQNFLGELEVQQRQTIQIDPFVVNQIVHMQSELQPEGARYTPLLRYSFG